MNVLEKDEKLKVENVSDGVVDYLYDELIKTTKIIKKNKNNISDAIKIITDSLKNKGKLFIFTSETPARLALTEVIEIYSRYDLKPYLFQAYHAGTEQKEIQTEFSNTYLNGKSDICLNLIKEGDVLLTFCDKSNLIYTKGLLDTAKAKNIKIILILYNKSYVNKFPSDLTIVAPIGYEDLTNIKNLNNSNLQKMFLSTILNGVMMSLGKTYKDNIVDINLENKEEIIYLVKKITQKEQEEVVEILERCSYKAKVAILVLLKNISINDAVNLIRANDGIIDSIIEEKL